MKRICSITTLSVVSFMGTVALSTASQSAPLSEQVQTSNKQLEELVDLCESAGDSDARFRCLLDQSSRLNQAKNLARQRGERENGGVTLIETEPSMHGPSSESPYVISESSDGGVVEYTFTFRIRPRATTDYTQEAQVLITYDESADEWGINTVSNEEIDPTPCSYASELQGECF